MPPTVEVSPYPLSSSPVKPAAYAGATVPKGPSDESWIEILPNRLYFATSNRVPSNGVDVLDRSTGLTYHYFSTDHSLVYWNFFLDFGPLNAGQTYRFCQVLSNKLRDHDRVVYYAANHGQRQANSSFLMAFYSMLYLKRPTAEEAFAPFAHLNLPPFHDATPGVCTYKLTVMDVLRGVQRSKSLGFLDFDKFDVAQYEHFERVENGDASWIFPGKFLAFAGPHETKSRDEMYPTSVPEDYVPFFKASRIGMVIRLNKKYYDETRFTREGIDHADIYFPDGSCPPPEILEEFLAVCEALPKNVAAAVHCKAGLGRTGTCIGAYAMKHWGYTAAEVIGWMRFCRPGSVIGPQQQFLEQIQFTMHRLGREMYSNASTGSSENTVINDNDFGLKHVGSPRKSLAPLSPPPHRAAAPFAEEEISQGDELISARINSPAAPSAASRKSIVDAAAAQATSSDSFSSTAFYSFRTVARKLSGLGAR